MKKNNIRAYVILAVVFAAFTVIAFAVQFVKNAGFVIAYVSAVIAVAAQLYVYKISFADGGDVKSKFYGFPIARLGVIYLVVQLVISLVEMGLAFIAPIWIYIVVNVLVLAFAAVGCISADAVRDEIERQDIKLKRSVSAMRELQSLSNSIAVQCSNDELKPVLKKLADDFRFSDPVTCGKTVEAENELAVMLSDLQSAALDNDADSVKSLCAKASALLNERNRICKLNK